MDLFIPVKVCNDTNQKKWLIGLYSPIGSVLECDCEASILNSIHSSGELRGELRGQLALTWWALRTGEVFYS